MKRLAVLVAAGVLLGGCGGGSEPAGSGKAGDGNDGGGGASLTIPGVGGATDTTPPGPAVGGPTSAPANIVRRADSTVREPAVAGLWYPYQPAALRKLVDGALSLANAVVTEKVRAIIAPHAGYRFSGLTAAAAYKQLMGQDVETAIIMAASHYSMFEGASLPKFQAYRTPLGDVPVSPLVAKLAQSPPFVLSPKAQVKRPFQNPSKLPPPDGDTPHTWEHTIESQLPFLQWTVPGCKIVPVLYGQKVDPAAAAAVLDPLLDEKTVLIASTDLSHYHPYDEAKSIDAWFLKAVEEMDLATMASSTVEACGKGPVLTLMQIAKRRGWKPRVMNYRTSGDLPKADRKKVVGYAGVVFVEEGTVKGAPLTEADGKVLLGLARKTITDVVTKQSTTIPDPKTFPSRLRVPRAVFVTINREGKLRGCIGTTAAVQPLYRAVVEQAAAAALRDPRFKPVAADEFAKLTLEVSILTLPKSIYYNTPSDLLKALRPNVDGVVLQIPVSVGGRVAVAQGVYLPTVWKQIPQPEQFLQQLTLKAKGSLEARLSAQAKQRVTVNLSPDAWRSPQARVLTFQTRIFEGPLVGG